jgi:ATP-dependent DNA helicase RecG
MAGTEPKDFLKRPHSEPVNEKIATALFKGGEMEGWGRGIPDIYDLCKEAGMPEPEFDFVPNYVCLTIRFKSPLVPYVSGGDPTNGPLNDPINDPLNGLINGPLKAVVGKVYQMILSTPGIKNGEISKKIGKSESTIKRYVKLLTDGGLVEYRDSKKTGGLYPVKK